ncbi:MAG: phenylalanine--tRNA ligase subunit alpha [Deltaproteobacteria bacterium]|nr:phenylalanine--tRNA ligase subunit alpha [Deltaproteobacteria bacterium]
MPTGVENLGQLESQARAALEAAQSVQALTEARARFLGRKGSISSLLRGIGALDPAERGRVGQAVNASKQRIDEHFQARRRVLEAADQARAMERQALDVTLPGLAPPRGHLHPVTLIEREMTQFFSNLGFSIELGPEVETEYYNFEALNIPADHPSRDTQDTFFVEGGHVLRTHTSPVQIRAMSGRQPPFRFIAPGRVFRHDSDATHYPMFHQIEGFLVDERVTFGDLKGVLYAFARQLMGPEVKLRFRAHFFPFTEPSAEMDFSWRGDWLEWGGCGMIHPRVLENCGIDSERYQGFAFGMGIDRTAMLRFGIPNIHLLFDGDVRVLEQI